MNFEEAKAIVGSDLSVPSKMPGYAFSLPMCACITGAKLASIKGTVCNKCYANRGNYLYPVVLNAMTRRLENLNHPQWVEAMTTLIKYKDSAHFRWFDSGDLQSVQNLENIAEIARRLPYVKFWLPTREYTIVQEWMDRGGIKPKNLIIRLSAHMVDGPLPRNLAKQLGVLCSGVHKSTIPKKAKICDARQRGNQCGECRACWDSRVKAVSYPMH